MQCICKYNISILSSVSVRSVNIIIYYILKKNVCNYLAVGDSFSSHVTGTSYTINHRLDCDSRNVVSLINCKVCGLQYVGSTTTKFRI